VFTRPHHRPLSGARLMQSTPFQPTLSTLTLSSLLHLAFQVVFSLQTFWTKILFAIPIALVRATCPVHLILDLVVRVTVGEKFKLWNFFIMRFSPLSCRFTPLGVLTVPSALSGPIMTQSTELHRRPCCRNTICLFVAVLLDLGL
jgi:hypothetical protein